MLQPVILASLMTLAAPAAQPDVPSPFVEWARGRAVPIDSARRGFAALDAGLAEARLIGVGESVHEAEPFLGFRTRLLQHLVREHRVTALALESGMPEAVALDDYVRGRTATVDFDAVLPGGFGNLQEIRRAMEWLREWNLGAGKARPVAVYGVDLPGRSGSMVPALDRLAALTTGDAAVAAAIAALRPVAVQLDASWWRPAAEKYAALADDGKVALASDVHRLAQAVNERFGGDSDAHAWARRLARVAEQHEESLRLGQFSATVPRDRAMAENTFWVLDRIAPRERAVYWAHNAHVQRVPVQGPKLPPGRFRAAGNEFGEKLGKAYYAIGTTYGGPALDDGSAALAESVDGALASVGAGPAFLVVLRGGEAPAAVQDWLSEERPMRFQVGHLLVSLGSAFDAVAYFDGATEAARVEP